ncbi:MAG: FMN-dependent NADH-azoreductase [Betaproteobacteria bacterium]|jgi:Acyl carrier protein phosphodiesterase|nr:FMN-dependent NADH-azoreductase [Betaproteobacteria bacterium]
MTTLLQINSSIHAGQGQSSQLADVFVASFLENNPETQVIKRDLADETVPHLTAERFGAFLAKPEERTETQRSVIAYSDELILELTQADILALGVPMYNFGIPSQLKSYFDHIARAGITFRYTSNGPEGLLKGKKAYVFATRGGVYAGTVLDSQTNYVRDFLGFVGISDVVFIYAESLAISPDIREESLARATVETRRLAA